jgi:hypothetical protein
MLPVPADEGSNPMNDLITPEQRRRLPAPDVPGAWPGKTRLTRPELGGAKGIRTPDLLHAMLRHLALHSESKC